MKDLAIQKLNKELKELRSNRYVDVMKQSVHDALVDFCRQDNEFAQAVHQGGSFQECMDAVAAGVTSAISDLDAYRRAVQYYFPGADIRVSMTVDLCASVRKPKEPKQTADKALALLAVPAEEREQFAEAVHADELSVRELKAKIKEMENQARGWQIKAEQAKQEAEEHEEALKQAETKAGLQEKLISSLRVENRVLEDNVEELKNRPVEVSATVDATEEQLREAEKRGHEAAMLDAQREHEDLQRQNQELSQALEAARLETDQYQGTNEDLLAQIEALKKRRVQADEPMVEMKLLFKQLQETANAMAALMPQVDEVNRAMLRKALPGALRQLAERMEG